MAASRLSCRHRGTSTRPFRDDSSRSATEVHLLRTALLMQCLLQQVQRHWRESNWLRTMLNEIHWHIDWIVETILYICGISLPTGSANKDIERFNVSAFLSNLDTLILIGGQWQRLCPCRVVYSHIPDIWTRALLLVHKEGSIRPDKRTRTIMFVSFFAYNNN